VLKGHTGSVLCLQYDDNYIISASSDSTVRSLCVHVTDANEHHHCTHVHRHTILMAMYQLILS